MWKVIRNTVVGIFAVFGVLFIILMLLPDDEEENSNRQTDVKAVVAEQTVAEQTVAEQTIAEQTVAAARTKEVKSRWETADRILGSEDSDVEVETVSVGTGAKSATIMVYINGSDLESEAGEATKDISEMIASGIGDKVNVIIQTMGTRHWQNYGISSRSAQTYKIEKGELKLIRDKLGQLDCTDKRTLSEFIGFCKSEYPADRYMILFWDHGGGPVYGFGYDEWQSEQSSLTIAEMAEAFSENDDVHFDLIGMDCCIMASMETCYALAPYCKYALLSEDFESGLGWSYTGWMKEFEEDPGIATPLLGKHIIDSMIEDNENRFGGGSSSMGLFNTATAKDLYEAWKTYAYKNESALMKKNYSKSHKAKGRSYFDMWGYDYSYVTLSDYYISDILALVEGIDKDSKEAKNLISTLKASVVYFGHTSDKNELTGLAVSLPYGDMDFYNRLRSVYSKIGLDEDYIDWLGGFVKSSGYNDYYDYYSFENNWGGWGDYESDYGCNISSGASCQYGYDYNSCYDGGSWCEPGYNSGYNSYYGGGSYCDSSGYGSYCDSDSNDCYDDWIYDYDEEIWYCYDDGYLYLYDEESDTLFYYDEESDIIYCYNEYTDSWEYCE